MFPFHLQLIINLLLISHFNIIEKLVTIAEYFFRMVKSAAQPRESRDERRDGCFTLETIAIQFFPQN